MQRNRTSDATGAAAAPSPFARLRLIAVSAVLLVAGVTAAAATAAAPEGQISVLAQQAGAPVSFFELSGSPGSTLQGNEILVRNGSDRPLRIAVQPVDAQTATNLGFAYESAGLGREGPTRWIDSGPKTFTAPPHTEIPIPVTVRIPDGAEAGDYLSGISIEALGQQTESQLQEGVAIGNTQRYTIGAMVTVPGPRSPRIELTGASVAREPAGVTFFLDASNTGNVLLREVTGWVTVSRGNKQIASARLGPGTFVTGTSFAYPLLAAEEQPSEGTEYRVQAELHYGEDVARLDQNVVFDRESAQLQEEFGGPPAETGLPLWIPLLTAAVLILAALAVILIRRRRLAWAPISPKESPRRLESEIEAARASGLPLSMIRVVPDRADENLLRPILVEILPRVRAQDSVCHLGNGELMIVAPDTAASGAAGMATEFERLIARSGRLTEMEVSVRATSHEVNASVRS
jgi:hypothetical protein